MCAWAFCLPSGQGKGQTNTHVAPLSTLPRFRVLCQTVIAHKLFDYVVLAFIFLNCITIALERPQIEAGSTVSGWGLQAVQGTRQRDRLPRLAVGWHAGLGLESSTRPDATEGGVAGSWPLERGLSPWTVKWQPLLGVPWLKAEAGGSGSSWIHGLSGSFRNASSSLCPTTSSQLSSWAR